MLLLSIIQDFVNHEFHERVFHSNSANVIDGDTIVLDGVRIRLQGLDAPELKQTCQDKQSGSIWQCGLVAKKHLESLVENYEVSCTNEGLDKYRRQLSYCYANDMNLNREMVRSGMASSYTKFDMLFLADEIAAKLENRGIWSSNFEDPEVWRKSRKEGLTS
ncbi:MAG: thermonuclease family protein [Candidatus Lariskella arthropodorum]